MNTVEQNVVNTGKLFDPRNYFKTHEGLWCSSDFTDRILAKQSPTMPCRGLDGVVSHNLAHKMIDRQVIRRILGGMDEVRSHAFTLDQIATMIDLQPNGEDGELSNNGSTNIFYVLMDRVLFAVGVNWALSVDRNKWKLRAWHLGENCNWGANSRVFRNTALIQ